MPKKKDIMQFQRTRRYTAGVTAINAADGSAMATVLDDHGKKLDLDMVSFYGLSSANQAAIRTALVSGKEYTDRNAVAAVFNPALEEYVALERAIEAINVAGNASIVKAALERYAEVLDIDLKDYARLSIEGKEAVCEAIMDQIEDDGPFADAESIKQFVEETAEETLEEEALEAINVVSGDTPEELAEMEGVLEDYWDVFKIEEVKMDAYRGLDDLTGKPEVHDALQGKTYEAASAVKTDFDTAVDAQVTAEETAVTAINAVSTEGDMGTALGTHKAILGIAESFDSGDYDGLSDKTGVHDALIALRDFETIAEIRDAFNDAVADAKAAEEAGNGSGEQG